MTIYKMIVGELCEWSLISHAISGRIQVNGRQDSGMAPEAKRTRLFLHLKKWLEKAVLDYGMISAGDRVLVGVSGGMDSLSLVDLLDTPMIEHFFISDRFHYGRLVGETEGQDRKRGKKGNSGKARLSE
jgi:hypothetical protein